jgi:TonB family protein
MIIRTYLSVFTVAIICAFGSVGAEESQHSDAPLVDPSTLAVDHIACADTMGYPELAAQHGTQGVSAIEVEVTQDGRVTPLAIVRKSGATSEHRLLDRAAFQHFGSCRLPPQTERDVVRTVLFYTWKLE